MALVGWVCLEHAPKLPFLWSINGRGYAPFFIGVLLSEFQDKAQEPVRKGVSTVWTTLILGFLVIRLFLGFEAIFGAVGGNSYVRYFEFIAAPGLILAALNLEPVRKCLEWKPFLWLGMLSGVLYYVHNNVMEDYRIINCVTGNGINFSSGWIFLLVLASTIPVAILWRVILRKLHLYRADAPQTDTERSVASDA